ICVPRQAWCSRVWWPTGKRWWIAFITLIAATSASRKNSRNLAPAFDGFRHEYTQEIGTPRALACPDGGGSAALQRAHGFVCPQRRARGARHSPRLGGKGRGRAPDRGGRKLAARGSSQYQPRYEPALPDLTRHRARRDADHSRVSRRALPASAAHAL